MIKEWRLRRLRKKYYVGAKLSRFVACDIRRDVQVVDASEVDNGFITVASRTWNVLYATKGMTPKPEFGEPHRVAIPELWQWKGPSWGGPVSEGETKREA
ncbi:MAG: hypothetical protein ACYTG0_16945 [Planctomycetota bacterium]